MTPRFRKDVKEVIVTMGGKRKKMITPEGQRHLMSACPEELNEIPGLGEVKARQLWEEFRKLAVKL